MPESVDPNHAMYVVEAEGEDTLRVVDGPFEDVGDARDRADEISANAQARLGVAIQLEAETGDRDVEWADDVERPDRVATDGGVDTRDAAVEAAEASYHVHCPDCGKKIGMSAAFCPGCGADVGGAIETSFQTMTEHQHPHDRGEKRAE